MAAVPYFDLVREMTDAYKHRVRVVQFARQNGIKPAARQFPTTVPTVRKWLRRYQQHGLSGPRELSRAHRSCPHKTSLSKSNSRPWRCETSYPLSMPLV